MRTFSMVDWAGEKKKEEWVSKESDNGRGGGRGDTYEDLLLGLVLETVSAGTADNLLLLCDGLLGLLFDRSGGPGRSGNEIDRPASRQLEDDRTQSMSLSRSSFWMISMSRIGLTSPSTWMTSASSNARTTWKMASTARTCDRKALPRPAPVEAPARVRQVTRQSGREGGADHERHKDRDRGTYRR